MKRLYFFLYFLAAYALDARSAITFEVTNQRLSSSNTHVSFDLLVTRIPEVDLWGQDRNTAQLSQYLKIFVNGLSEEDPIQYGEGTENVSGVENDLYWENISDPILEDGLTAGNKKISYKVRILNNTAKGDNEEIQKISTLISNNNFSFKVGIQRSANAGQDIAKSRLFEAAQSFLKPNESPKGLNVEGEMESLVVKWDVVDEVLFTDGVTKDKPDQMMIMVFNKEATPQLKMKKINTDKESEDTTSVVCSYKKIEDTVDDATGTNCIVCDATDTTSTSAFQYFISSQQDPHEGMRIVVTNNDGEYQLTNDGSSNTLTLANGETYDVALLYLDGSNPGSSLCKQASPEKNLSLTELNGGKQAELGDPRCFIVSAAFGSPFAKHVDVFRWFRDSYLLNLPGGETIVNFYYEYSQPLANLIKESSVLKIITKSLLWPVAMLLYFLQFSVLSWALLALVFLVGVVFYYRRKQALRLY